MSEEVMSWIAIAISLLAIIISSVNFAIQLRRERRLDAEAARDRQRLLESMPPEVQDMVRRELGRKP